MTNEQLLRRYKKALDDIEIICTELLKQLKCRKRECEKYKRILIRIKEIADENIRIADLEGLNGVYRRGLAKQILQKNQRGIR